MEGTEFWAAPSTTLVMKSSWSTRSEERSCPSVLVVAPQVMTASAPAIALVARSTSSVSDCDEQGKLGGRRGGGGSRELRLLVASHLDELDALGSGVAKALDN